MSTKEHPSKETLEQWHSGPNNWKLGIFYFNKEDKRIFPPKRNALAGWTVNFANPISIVSMVIVIGVLLYFSGIFT